MEKPYNDADHLAFQWQDGRCKVYVFPGTRQPIAFFVDDMPDETREYQPGDLREATAEELATNPKFIAYLDNKQTRVPLTEARRTALLLKLVKDTHNGNSR